ncbi:hypothetical protein [uncultured Kordia sp.]|nr:hypothetical protein [uncultured Kordia sp.]
MNFKKYKIWKIIKTVRVIAQVVKKDNVMNVLVKTVNAQIVIVKYDKKPR